MRSPPTNGICERFHKTVLDEFYRVTFRKKLYTSIEQLQADLDAWLREYNEDIQIRSAVKNRHRSLRAAPGDARSATLPALGRPL